MNIQLGDGCPDQVTAVLFPLAAEGEEGKATCLLGASAFQIRKLELEVKRKGVNWMRDLTTVWSTPFKYTNRSTGC